MTQAQQYGKPMPSAIDLEQAVLGAIMIDNKAMELADRTLYGGKQFYIPRHAFLYEMFKEMHRKRIPIDLLTAADYLKKKLDKTKLSPLAKVDPYYLVELTNRVASASNIEYHCRVIAEKAMRRQMIEAGHKAIRAAYDESEDIIGTISDTQTECSSITNRAARGAIKDIKEEVRARFQAYRDKDIEKKHGGLPFGVKVLDWVGDSLGKTDLNVIAGRPGSGKTALALQIAKFLAIDYVWEDMEGKAFKGVPVGFFSYEMSNKQLIDRMVSNHASVNGRRLGKKVLDEDELVRLDAIEDEFYDALDNLHFDDSSDCDALQLKAKIVNLILEKGVKIVFVDYLQLIKTVSYKRKDSVHEQLGETCQILKNVAKEYGIPIVLLAQLSKETEANKFCQPRMKNLRDTGKIEDVADRIWLVWRPDYHGYNTIPLDEMNPNYDVRGKVCVLQVKYRHGMPGEAWMAFEGEYSRFRDLTSFDEIIETAASADMEKVFEQIYGDQRQNPDEVTQHGDDKFFTRHQKPRSNGSILDNNDDDVPF